ncbi:vitamin B12-dependent ribonucleotide reductase, partial [Myxococcota bacterium]|nr:vitamin B12-dependent ribonucleotide reductase [Myxococcota bacterium]
GVPLKALVDKFSHTRFEPSGFTNNKKIPIAKSVMDYVFRYLGDRYLAIEETNDGVEESAGNAPIALPTANRASLATVTATPAAAAGAVAGGSGSATTDASQSQSTRPATSFVNQADAPSCMDCGSIMIRNGACYKCPNCGSTSGCS